MLKKRKPVLGGNTKLNLIPIMDAVFIFIFFLLFSAQFIKIFEHGSDAPVVSDAPPIDKLEKDPLNLKIRIDTRSVKITTGLAENEYKRIDLTGDVSDYAKINDVMMELKNNKAKKDDDYAILIPSSKVKYEIIIKIMDAVRFVPEAKVPNVDPKKFPEGKIFERVVLEPIE